MNVTHQAHAARCRHKAAHHAKAQFWAALDHRFSEFRLRFPRESLKRFISVERRRAHLSASACGFRISTLMTWLREWREREASTFAFTSLSTAYHREDAGSKQPRCSGNDRLQ